MNQWKIDGYQAVLTLDASVLKEGEILLDDAAARYFGLGLTDERDRRLTFYYEGREYPSYARGGKEAQLDLSKALTSRLIGVFPDYEEFFKEDHESEPTLLFDKKSNEAYALRLDLPWNKGIRKKHDFFDYLGTGLNPGQLKDAYDIVFVRELFDNLDNRGYADVFMVSGKLKKKLVPHIDENGIADSAAARNIENLEEAGLDDILSFLMEDQYQRLADRDFILMQQLDEHFLFKLDPDLYSELSTDDRRFIVKKMDDKLEAYYARQNAPSLTESLESFMFDYINFFNKDFRYSYKDVITDHIPAGLINLGLIDLTRYNVNGFAGVDDWAEIPYISIGDVKEARLRDSGLYIAFLLDKNSQTIYLSLLIGYEPIREELSHQGLEDEALETATNRVLTQTVDSYRHQLDLGDFLTESDKIELSEPKYKNAVIGYKIYNKRAPLEETVKEDLEELLGIYEKALEVNPADYTPPVVEIKVEETEEIEPEETEVITEPEEAPEEVLVEEETKEAPEVEENIEDIVKLVEEETEPREKVVYEDTLEEPEGERSAKEVHFADLLEESAVQNKFPRLRKHALGRISKLHPDSIISKEAIENVRSILSENPSRATTRRRLNLDQIPRRTELTEYVEPENTKDVMEDLEKDIRAQGYSPTENLIKDLYLSLKTYPLVALMGRRGSDLDKFVRLYAKSLGATFENGRFLQTRVKNTKDTQDKMFGYYNPYSSLFTEGVLTDFILHAVEEPDAPFFIYLKDLPLNSEEDFLGELLSIYDTRREHGDEIITDPILRYEQFGQDEEAMSRYNGLYLPNNLFIIASLARGNYSEAELGLLSHISVLNVGVDTLKLSQPKESGEMTYYGSQFLHGDLLELSENEDEKDMIHDVIILLEAINGILTRINAQIGPRERDEICLFLLYNAQEGLLSQDEALDLAILQKIIPRVYGSDVLVDSVLTDLFKICAGTRNGEAIKNYQDEGGLFPKSAKKLSQMAKEVERGQFASVFTH